MTRRAVVIGGGVVGAACAHYLARDHWEVTIVDEGRFGGACSHGNCGFVCPSHLLPLAEPGAVRRAFGAMLRRNSPLSIRPRLDWTLWSWMLQFARHCNERDMLAAGRACQPLLDGSLEEYRRLVQAGIECEWQERGLLFAYRERREFESYAPTDRLLGDKFQAPARRLVGEELRELEPALADGLAGGWYYEHDAHLRPDMLLASWRAALERNGVRIVEQTRWTGLEVRSGRAELARAGDLELAAEAVVVATGAWTPLLRKQLGVRIPIEPGKGYSLTMSRPAAAPAVPMIFPETRVAVTPWPSGLRLGSTMEFAGYDRRVREDRLRLLIDGARPYLQAPVGEVGDDPWYGWRPMTPDGLPVIDRAPVAENVWIAAGHNMLGLSMAPATGRLVAELVSGAKPHVDPTPYSARRFA